MNTKQMEWVCCECGSNNVQSKAWVSLNNQNKIDFIAAQDSDDYWCENCAEHNDVKLRPKKKVV